MTVVFLEKDGQLFVKGVCTHKHWRGAGEIVGEKVSSIPGVSHYLVKVPSCDSYNNVYNATKLKADHGDVGYFERVCLNCVFWEGDRYPQVLSEYRKQLRSPVIYVYKEDNKEKRKVTDPYKKQFMTDEDEEGKFIPNPYFKQFQKPEIEETNQIVIYIDKTKKFNRFSDLDLVSDHE